MKVRDAAGNVAGPIVGSISLDTAAPQVVSAVLNQKPYATSASVTLSFSVSALTRCACPSAATSPARVGGAYGNSGALSFSGADGLKVAYVQFRDNAGNATAILSDVTTLDTSAPYAPQLTINNKDPSTVFALVNLTLSAVGADEMHLRGGVNDTGGVPYQPSRSDNLIAGGGTKVINVQFRDRAGNLSAPTSASIDYLPPPIPVGVVATGGTAKVSLTWGASSGATGYDVRRSGVSGGPYASIGTPVGISFDDTTVTPGVTYYYVVRATSAAGASLDSVQVSASTVPSAPTGLTAKAGAHRIAPDLERELGRHQLSGPALDLRRRHVQPHRHPDGHFVHRHRPARLDDLLLRGARRERLGRQPRLVGGQRHHGAPGDSARPTPWATAWAPSPAPPTATWRPRAASAAWWVCRRRAAWPST
ncbi:MAG: hypothetical protein QM765_40110 [Myxococcales bacterium]